MAKVTIVIEDITDHPEKTLEVTADFEQPGKSYQEMIDAPTSAISVGLMLIENLKHFSSSYTGKIVDEFGNTQVLKKSVVVE